MVKLLERKIIDPESIHRSLQSGFGIEHPERVNGYTGFFFNIGDVYVSKRIARWIENPKNREFVLDCVKRLENDDYGMVSDGDESENIENKWICGAADGIFGRYGVEPLRPDKYGRPKYCEIIKLRCIKGNTYILFDSELDTEIFEI